MYNLEKQNAVAFSCFSQLKCIILSNLNLIWAVWHANRKIVKKTCVLWFRFLSLCKIGWVMSKHCDHVQPWNDKTQLPFHVFHNWNALFCCIIKAIWAVWHTIRKIKTSTIDPFFHFSCRSNIERVMAKIPKSWARLPS